MCFLISIQIQRLWLWFSLHPKMILKYNWLGGLKKFLGLWNMGSVDLPFLGWKFLVWTFLEIFSFCLQTLLCHFHIKTSWTGANHMQMTRMSIRLSLLAELSWFCFQADKERMIWESSSGLQRFFGSCLPWWNLFWVWWFGFICISHSLLYLSTCWTLHPCHYNCNIKLFQAPCNKAWPIQLYWA